MRSQYTNRVYETQHDNEMYRFLKALDTEATFEEIAKKLGRTYHTLYYTYKRNRMTYDLKCRIENAYQLTPEQKAELNTLILDKADR